MEDEVGDERLLERRGEALDELMRQAADEADRVGDEVAAALVLEAARRRVERLEEPVADGDRGVGERVQERRLADVRVAGERDGRRLGAAALLAAHVALAAQLLEPARGAARSRRRAIRRSVSSCDSPGPRVPTPPPSRSRCCHMPRIRGRLYSSCASSTWSLPSALTACWAKMSRISSARSTTRAWSSFSSMRCCDGRELVVDEQDLRAGVVVGLLQLLELPFADVRARVRLRPVLDEPCDRLDARRPGELLELCELVVCIDALREHGQDEPALGLGARRGIGLSYRHLRVIVLDVRCGRPLTSHFPS